MPELLLELLSEEIPARMQAGAAVQLEELMVKELKAAGLEAKDSRAFVTPRRLALHIGELPVSTADVREERKGPRVGAPEKALEGFLRSTGLTKADLKTQSDAKGEFYIAVTEKRGRPTVEVLAEIIPAIVANFHWPKSMRWGAGTLRWVRPLHNVLCIFGGKTVPLAIDTGDRAARGDGILRANHNTYGHRFLAPQQLHVTSFEDYREQLARAHVVLDREERKAIIMRDLARLAAAEGLEPIEDAGLLEEVCGLVEDPVVLIGKIDKEFLDVPPEVLSTAMRAHQKYFSLRDAKTKKFAPRFGVVTNLRAADGGKAIIAGNERVLRARLSDARFFWDQDRKVKLADRVDALKGITFHAKLGTQAERVQRIERLARVIAPLVGANPDEAARAAQLCKADLTSGMVGEFPELQGVMGRYYALKDGESEAIADAISDHYRPQGPNDSVPTAPISIAVALADKLDMLAGFWAIDEKPTGSRDPFALRRAALGVIRVILENRIDMPLTAIADFARLSRTHQIASKRPIWVAKRVGSGFEGHVLPTGSYDFSELIPFGGDTILWDFEITDARIDPNRFEIEKIDFNVITSSASVAELRVSQFQFIADRLKVYLRDRGARHDLVDAVFSLPGQDDLVLIVKRVEALSTFLATEDGKSLLTAHDRAANILRIEEKKDNKQYTDEPDERLIAAQGQPEERELLDAIFAMQKEADAAIEKTDFEAAMRALAQLRAPVDKFFDKVTVNAKEPALRENRLKLLSLIRRSMSKIADFSKIEGSAK